MYDTSSVTIVSRNYSTGLGVIRSLGEAGYKPDLVASVIRCGSADICKASKYLSGYSEVRNKEIIREGQEELIQAIANTASGPEVKRALIPVDDYTMRIVDDHRSALEDKFLIPFTDNGCKISSLMDKTEQFKRAAEVGLKVPRSISVPLNKGIVVPDGVVYPCFVKPGRGYTGVKQEMKRCDNENELAEHLQLMKINNPDRDAVVQEYLDIEKEYDICGVALGEEIIIPGLLDKLRVACYERGVTLMGRMCHSDVLGTDILRKIKSMMAGYGYHGLFDMELDVVSGELYFGEINFRCGGPCYAYTLAGANLPAILVNELTKKRHDSRHEVIDSVDKSYLYEKVAWEDYIHGFMTKKELRRLFDEADSTLIASDSDPDPGRVFDKKIRLSACKHRLLRFVGKE